MPRVAAPVLIVGLLFPVDPFPLFTFPLCTPPVSNAPRAFPRLMHINPTMSGPVYLRKNKDSVAPWGVGFAGAEFVVLSKTVVGVEEVWEVVSEVRACVVVFLLTTSLGRDLGCQATKGEYCCCLCIVVYQLVGLYRPHACGRW